MPRPHTRWRPVRSGGTVVDFVLADFRVADPLQLGLPADVGVIGRRMTELFPDSPVSGRLAAFASVATTGTPFRFTRPGSVSTGRIELVVSRTPRGDVVVELEGEGGGPDSAGSRDAQRWQRLYHDTPLGVAVLTFDGVVVEANPAVLGMLGRRSDEVLGRLFHDFAHPEDGTRLDRSRLMRTGYTTMRKRYVRADGSDLWLRVTAALVVEDSEQRIVSMCEDVTAGERAQAELRYRAERDPLTGLANRDALRARLRKLLAEPADPAGGGAALLFLDLDRFKVVNDSLGHGAGDRLLTDVAERLRGSVPPEALLARLGGDEFAVVLPDGHDPVDLASRLVALLQAPFTLDGREVGVGASVGVAVCAPRAVADPHDAGSAADALLRDADTAMYAAKRSESGPVAFFDDRLRRRAVARLEDEQGLRTALQRGELRLHYQPIKSLPDLRTTAVEALVRWQHPERGLLAPGAFLPAAEETGLMVPLGRFALREACRQLAQWRADGHSGTEGVPLRVSVNVAAQHLAARTLVADVEAALAAAGLEPAALTLEITEQALVASATDAAADLAELRRRGCLVALDDFGTGYSSLAYLRQLPVDVLKIDRTFVAGAGTADNDGSLLRAITALGASLGLETVSEGVETEGELEAVRAAGATAVQGYLLGRPAAA